MLGCGLRTGEALALRWADVCLDGPSPRLSVTQALADIPVSMTSTERVGRKKGLSSTKTKSSPAKVPTPGFVVEALHRQRTRVAVLRLASVVWDEDLDLAFPSSVGTPLDPAQVGRLQATIVSRFLVPLLSGYGMAEATLIAWQLAQGVFPHAGCLALHIVSGFLCHSFRDNAFKTAFLIATESIQQSTGE